MTTVVKTVSGAPLPGVNIFQSDATGNMTPSGMVFTTDADGVAILPVFAGSFTFSFVGLQRQTWPADAIPAEVILQEDPSTELQLIEVTAPAPFDMNAAILWLAAIIVLVGGAYLLKSSLFKL